MGDVNVIDLTDRRPLEFEGRYLWHPQQPDDPPGYYHDHLPREVFDALTGMIPRDNPRVHTLVKAYTTRDAAMTALRAAVGGAAVSHDRGEDEPDGA